MTMRFYTDLSFTLGHEGETMPDMAKLIESIRAVATEFGCNVRQTNVSQNSWDKEKEEALKTQQFEAQRKAYGSSGLMQGNVRRGDY